MVVELEDTAFEDGGLDGVNSHPPHPAACGRHPSEEGNEVSASGLAPNSPPAEGCREAAGWGVSSPRDETTPSELDLYKYAVEVFSRKNLPLKMLQAADLSSREKIESTADIFYDALQVNRRLQAPEPPAARGYTPRAAGVDALRGIRNAMGITG